MLDKLDSRWRALGGHGLTVRSYDRAGLLWAVTLDGPYILRPSVRTTYARTAALALESVAGKLRELEAAQRRDDATS